MAALVAYATSATSTIATSTGVTSASAKRTSAGATASAGAAAQTAVLAEAILTAAARTASYLSGPAPAIATTSSSAQTAARPGPYGSVKFTAHPCATAKSLAPF